MARKASASPRTIVRTTALLDVKTHAKVCAAAALRGQDRGVLLGELVRIALASVTVFDPGAPRAESAGNLEQNQEQGRGGAIAS